jgi:peptide/nickel transport system permease protein
MLKYVVTRLLLIFPTLLGLAVFDFILLYLTPGGPVGMIIAQLRPTGGGLNPTQIAFFQAKFGLNVPPPVQFERWFEGVLQGNLGTSYFLNAPVSTLILDRLPVTLTLTIVSTIMALLAAIPLGVLSAVKRNSIIDYATRILSLVGISMPTFWLGFLLISLFSFDLHLFPAVGYANPFTLEGVKYFILPSLALALSTLGIIARILRASMVEALGEDYILTARSKGLKERIVIYRHAFRNAMIPTLTLMGLYFGSSLSGVVTIEYVFHYLGIGDLALTAILSRDYPLIEAFVLYTGLIFVLANTVVDILYAVIDPRIRLR